MKLTAFDEERLVAAITPLILRAYDGRMDESDIYRNTLDCFSAVIDSVILGISLEQWVAIDRNRQTQKSLQNVIGELHQEILGSKEGWKSLGKGEVLDLVNHPLKIMAEIKNKFNTSKGNHKREIYNDLDKHLSESADYSDYVGYYVEILPSKSRKVYDIPFTPSDNRTGEKKPINERIRKIDGRSFYARVAGEEDALDQVFYNLPRIVLKILKENNKVKSSDGRTNLNAALMIEMFSKAYKK